MKFEDYNELIMYGVFNLKKKRINGTAKKRKYTIKITKKYVKFSNDLRNYFIYIDKLYFSKNYNLDYVLITTSPTDCDCVMIKFDDNGRSVSDIGAINKLRGMLNVEDISEKFENIVVSNNYSTPISIRDFFAAVLTE